MDALSIIAKSTTKRISSRPARVNFESFPKNFPIGELTCRQELYFNIGRNIANNVWIHNEQIWDTAITMVRFLRTILSKSTTQDKKQEKSYCSYFLIVLP